MAVECCEACGFWHDIIKDECIRKTPEPPKKPRKPAKRKKS